MRLSIGIGSTYPYGSLPYQSVTARTVRSWRHVRNIRLKFELVEPGRRNARRPRVLSGDAAVPLQGGANGAPRQAREGKYRIRKTGFSFPCRPDFDKRSVRARAMEDGFDDAFSASRQKRRAGDAPRLELGGDPAGPPLRSPARAGGRLAIFFAAAMLTLAHPGIGQAADGLCPDEGSHRGRVAAVNERLELTLEGGIRLKIAGVDPPRPTPGDPDLDVRTRDRLAQWLLGNGSWKTYSSARLMQDLDRWGRLPAFVFAPGADLQIRLKSRPCPSLRRSSMRVSPVMSQARRHALAGSPSWPRRTAHEPRGLAFGPIRIMRSSPRLIAYPSRRKPVQLSLLKAALPASPIGGRVSCSTSGPHQGWDFSVTIFPRNSKAFEAAYAAGGLTAGWFAYADFSTPVSDRKSRSRTRMRSRSLDKTKTRRRPTPAPPRRNRA